MSVIGESGKQRLMAKLAVQAHDLVTKAGVAAPTVSELYQHVSVAIDLKLGFTHREVAQRLREMADVVDALADAEPGPSPSGAELN